MTRLAKLKSVERSLLPEKRVGDVFVEGGNVDNCIFSDSELLLIDLLPAVVSFVRSVNLLIRNGKFVWGFCHW